MRSEMRASRRIGHGCNRLYVATVTIKRRSRAGRIELDQPPYGVQSGQRTALQRRASKARYPTAL